MSEELLVRNCAPTLAGIKTGSLFSCPYGSREQVCAYVRTMNHRLAGKGLRILPLRYFQGRVLLYLFRPARLKRDLSDSAAAQLLQSAGYQGIQSERCILQLMARLKDREEFPHEIGLFLSYPPEDVQGFIQHRARNFKCSGCWKVYGDEQRAKKLFARYKRCTDVYYHQWSKGISVERLAVAL